MSGCCAPHINGIVVVPPTPSGFKVFQEDSTATRLSNTAVLTTFVILPGDAKVLEGAVWKINMCVLVCVPDNVFVNSEQVWFIETSPGVFTEFDRYSNFEVITIQSGEQSVPQHRTKKLTATMNAPRMDLRVRRRNAGSTAFFWEIPRWGGTMITEAP